MVARLVGDEFFRAMARVYVEEEPPKSAVLLRYGEGFPFFIAGFEPAQSVPYLADVAAVEWAWHAAYHAADAAPLPLDELAAVGASAADTMLQLHPSLSVVSSLYPAVSIWELHNQADEPGPTKLDKGGEDALIIRPYLDVEVRRLPDGAVPFIRALKGGDTILEAYLAACEQVPAFSIEKSLTGLMTSGAIVGLTEPAA